MREWAGANALLPEPCKYLLNWGPEGDRVTSELVHRIRQMVHRRSARYGSPACRHTDGLNHVTDSEH
jgi:hypothetical protein